MVRIVGIIAVFAFVFVVTASVIPQPSNADTAPSATGVSVDDNTMGDEKKDTDEKNQDKPKKKTPKYPYAKELRNKAKQPPPPPRPKPKYKDWGKTLKDAEAHDGLLKVWTRQEKVWFELTKSQLDVPYQAISHLSQGIGSHFIFGGLRLDNMMFDFHRHEDHIQIRRLSTQFRAPGDEGLEKAIDLTFGESIVASLPIVSEQNEGESVLVEINKYFLSDVVGLGILMNAVFNQPVRMDAKKGYFNKINVYPANLEIDTRLTFMPGRPQKLHLPAVPDSRYLQVGIHYSIFKLPEEPMTPRIRDDRVGFFKTTHKDFRQTDKENFFVHYANRWRLEKKDPGAEMSEPVKPIVYYIDHTVPEKYVPYVKRGVEMWQRAFEEIGFKNAIIAKRAPTPEEDPEYCPEDARYNTLRWNTSDQTLYGAIGPSQVDPRTGEILNADILFEHSMVANFGRTYKRLAEPRGALMSVDPVLKEMWMTEEEKAAEVTWDDVPMLRNQKHQYCNIGEMMAFDGNFMRVAMLGRGMLPPGDDLPLDFVGDALSWVVCHEVGHTLGLRHNFLSSVSTPFDKLNDKAVVEDIGMTGSIMDYASTNIAYNADDQGYYYSPTVGTYDRWAIRWAYSEVAGDTPEEQKKHIDKIAEEAWKTEHLYGTDPDAYPSHALDPRINIFDLSSDPLAWANERIMLIDELLSNGKLEDHVVKNGDNYVGLTNAITTLYIQKYMATTMAIKYIGGQYTARPHKGDPGDKMPLVPVDPQDQQRALDFIIDNAMTIDKWTLPPDLLNKLMADRLGTWENNLYAHGQRYDFPMSMWIGAVQNAVLRRLLNPDLQSRVVEAQYKVDRPFRLSTVYRSLTSKIWTDDPVSGGRYAGLHRNLQRIYVTRLIQQITMPMPGTPFDTIELSRLNLRRVRNSANTALQRAGLSDEANAHLMETVARIDRALDAMRVVGY